jgi:tetratricopeptide (TPR) repeat protein
MMSRSEQEGKLRKAIKTGLAARQQNPNDLTNLDVLGAAYQGMAELEQDPRKRKTDGNLKLALAVFRDAAQRSRLRIHKAAFLRAAGQVYGELGDRENQYRMAKLASEQTPFSSQVWDEVQDAALRVGRFADSRKAARKAREWTLPNVQVSSPMFSGAPPMGPSLQPLPGR